MSLMRLDGLSWFDLLGACLTSLRQSAPIVEREKTAILMTVIAPTHIWLATGGTNGCKWSSTEVCGILTGRDVILYPDLGSYEKWQEKSKRLKAFTNSLKISDLLEQHATENDKRNGLDVADYFIRCDADFGFALAEGEYPLFWDR